MTNGGEGGERGGEKRSKTWIQENKEIRKLEVRKKKEEEEEDG